jgi:hypothetical protein
MIRTQMGTHNSSVTVTALGTPSAIPPRNSNINQMDHRLMGCKGVDLISVPQDGDRWLVLVNTVIHFRFDRW